MASSTLAAQLTLAFIAGTAAVRGSQYRVNGYIYDKVEDAAAAWIEDATGSAPKDAPPAAPKDEA